MTKNQPIHQYKFLPSIIIGCVGCILAQNFIPFWWIFAPVIFIVAVLFQQKSFGRSFFSGMLSVFFAWLISYLYFDLQNKGLLSAKMAILFSLPSGTILFLVASLIMGIIGGLVASSAYFLRKN